MNSALEIEGLPLSAEILKDVRLHHSDVHTAQIQKIVQVGGSTIGHNRNDAQIVAIVKHLGQFIGQSHVGARQLTAGSLRFRSSLFSCSFQLLEFKSKLSTVGNCLNAVTGKVFRTRENKCRT